MSQIDDDKEAALPPAEIEGWEGEVLAMIHHELEQHKCFHGDGDMSSTPPMMYPEAIRCRIAFAHGERKQLEAELAAVTAERDRLTGADKQGTALLLSVTQEHNDELRAACEIALEHVTELRDAWMRGALHERDNLGGTRSNRNVHVEMKLRAALQQEEQGT